jgi:Copper type II ascorbate-dependent monooxygenase, C-terminal domain/Copper type II ascorbate-dependent monooxygenase, N-terminal domain
MAMHLRTGLALINLAAQKARIAAPIVVAVTTVLTGAGCVDFGSGGGNGENGQNGGSATDSVAPGGSAQGENGSLGLPCDVDTALEQHCRNCHTADPKFGAPMPLVTYEDLMKPALSDPSKKVYELVQSRVHDTSRPMPPPPGKPLEQSSLGAIDRWVNAGAKASSDASCDKGGSVDGGPKLSCTTDFTIKPPTPIEVGNSDVNEYVCYGVDVDLKQKRHVIGLAPHIDNAAVVHHLLLFQSDKAYSKTPQPCAAFGSASWRLVAGWAPGGPPMELPAEAGFPEEVGTTHWILQVHYNNPKRTAGLLDSSGYDLCTTDQLRRHDADVMAPGSVDFSIPAHGQLKQTCDYVYKQVSGVHVFGASPHMHKLGTSMSTQLIHNLRPTMIHSSPMFDFNYQSGYEVSAEIKFGDVLRTTCGWKNPTDKAVKFGENTEDEMCFNFLAYYPKITTPGFTWITPSVPLLSAICTNETK